MKLIIDIPEKVYNEYMDLATGCIPTYKACDIAWVLRKATPLPKEYSIMLKCPNCGLDVHSDFESCPRCGENLKARKYEERLQRERY